MISPSSVNVDCMGNIYFSDDQNGMIQKIDKNGFTTNILEDLGRVNSFAISSSADFFVGTNDGLKLYNSITKTNTPIDTFIISGVKLF